MRTSLNPLMHKDRKPFDWLETIPGVYSLILQPGQYKFDLCGGGGAGGAAGGTRVLAGGAGGGGGNGDFTSETIDLPAGASVTITVPTGGLTYVNGGNGGAGASGFAWGGSGGGGGNPAIIKIETNVDAYDWGSGLYTYDTRGTTVYDKSGNILPDWSVVWILSPDFPGAIKPTFTRTSDEYVYQPTGYSIVILPFAQYIFANGGGGGGGGGGGQSGSGYAGVGSGGGGGGGYYRYDITTNNTISVPGASGAAGGSNNRPQGGAGNPVFAVNGGHGGEGGHYKNSYPGGAGGAGGGAGGGGGGGDSGGHSSSHVGGGGGGAPGDNKAHGGVHGGGTDATSGTNPGTTGVPSVDPDGNTVSDGYGAGGNAGQNGYAGWVHITSIKGNANV